MKRIWTPDDERVWTPGDERIVEPARCTALGIGIGLGLGGGSGSFSPDRVATLGLWLDAGFGISASPVLSAWPDRSGNGNDFTPQNNPTWSSTGGSNNKPRVIADGTLTQFFSRNTAIFGTSAFTLFIVVKVAGALTNTNYMFGFGGTGGGFAFVAEGTTQNRGGIHNGVNFMLDGSSTNNWEIWSWRYDGANTFELNGANQVITNPSIDPLAPAAQATVFSRTSAGATGQGEISEIVGYTSAISSDDRLAVTTYLKTKYAL